jgi:hypothetical protein
VLVHRKAARPGVSMALTETSLSTAGDLTSSLTMPDEPAGRVARRTAE